MNQELKPKRVPLITTSQIWKECISIARENRPKVFTLLLLGIFLPQSLFYLFFAISGTSKAEQLKALFLTQQTSQKLNIMAVFENAVDFVLPYLGFGMIIMLLFIATYLSLTDLAYRHLTGRPKASVGELGRRGLKLTFFRGILMVLTLGILIVVYQNLLFPFLANTFMAIGLPQFLVGFVFSLPTLIMIVFGLLAPCLIVAEDKGGINSAWTAIRCRVSPLARSQPVQVFFALCGVLAIPYLGLMIIFGVQVLGFQFDQYTGIGRGAYLLAFPGTALPLVHLIVKLLVLGLGSLVLLFLPFGGVSAYLKLKKPSPMEV